MAFVQVVVLVAMLSFATAVPHPSIDPTTAPRIAVRSASTQASQSCLTEGQIVCSYDGKQYGLCANHAVTFQPVAAGTVCKQGVIVGDDSSTASTIAKEPQQPASALTTLTTTPIADPTSTSFEPATSAKGPNLLDSSLTTPTVSPTTKSTKLPSTTSSTSASTPTNALNTTSTTEGYHTYLGNGEPSEGWPTESDWGTFDDMWTKNFPTIISKGCTSGIQNTAQNNADLKAAILSVGNTSTVDPRFILAIVLQESNGCVRVKTTNYGVNNPGLMQCYNGTHTCYNQATCSDAEIIGMIHDGVLGATSSDPGLKSLIAKADTPGVAKYYRAARMYNSGSIASNGKLECGIATHSYASDVANRLTVRWYSGDSTFATPANDCPAETS